MISQFYQYFRTPSTPARCIALEGLPKAAGHARNDFI